MRLFGGCRAPDPLWVFSSFTVLFRAAAQWLPFYTDGIDTACRCFGQRSGGVLSVLREDSDANAEMLSAIPLAVASVRGTGGISARAPAEALMRMRQCLHRSGAFTARFLRTDLVYAVRTAFTQDPENAVLALWRIFLSNVCGREE